MKVRGRRRRVDKITSKSIREFVLYLRNCTDAQVHGVHEKEKQAGRDVYVALAEIEADRRALFLSLTNRPLHAGKATGVTE